MSVEDDLRSRANGTCELCASNDQLSVLEVPPLSDGSADKSIFTCGTCRDQIEHPDKMDGAHWQCLSDNMWTPTPAVQVVARRMLNRLNGQSWASELLDMLYLEDDVLAWAQAQNEDSADTQTVRHIDSNGAALNAGDTVTLIKDLVVKGAGFTAKRGTAVRGISLVPDNEKHIEGRVSGQQIVILTEFVKKSG